MSTETISAGTSPELANKMISDMFEQETAGVREKPPVEPAPLPPDTEVTLLGGLYNPITGDLTTTAEVRELTGADEEALAKIPTIGKMLMTILKRGVVSIGDKDATDEDLDELLSGDRELLLLAIRKVTFGPEVEFGGTCPVCQAEDQRFVVDLNEDVKLKTLDDPIADRQFTVKLRRGEADVTLPVGYTQKKLVAAFDKSGAELDTILLKDCVQSINGSPIIDVAQIKALGIGDRRKLSEEIGKRQPGPLLADIKKTCSACGQEVPLPLTLADLFRI